MTAVSRFFDGLQRFFVIVFRERFCRSAGTILYIFRCMPANWLRTFFPGLLMKIWDLLIRFFRPIFRMGPTPEKWSAYSVSPQYDGRCFRRARCRRRQRPWSRVHRRPLYTATPQFDKDSPEAIMYPYPLWYRRCPMRQCMDADNLHRRLKKIIGQVQAIDRMVDEDVPVRIFWPRSTQPSPPSTGAERWCWRAISSTASGTASSTATRQDHRELHQGGGAVFQYVLNHQTGPWAGLFLPWGRVDNLYPHRYNIRIPP